jgi:hypothetical protein
MNYTGNPVDFIQQQTMGNMANWGQPLNQGYLPNSFSLDPSLNPMAGNANGFMGMTQPMKMVGSMADQASWFDSFLGKKYSDGSQAMGWGSTLLDLGKAGMQGYLGLEQLGLAKDNLAFQKDAFSKQFENQRSLANTEMQDRQNARVASNPGAYQDTNSYMKQHGV